MSVGSALAEARVARGLSVDDLSADTRIRPHLIRAIEADDLAACGGDVYARGHVRALAKAVRADPEPLLAQMTVPVPAARSPLRAPAADPHLAMRERRAGSGWITAFAVALGVVASLAALRLVLPGDGGGSDASATSRRTSVTSPAAAASPRAARPATPARTIGSGALSVSIAVTGSRSWLEVKDSGGNTQLAQTLSRGQAATFRDDRKLSIVVGMVSAVTVTVNGRQVRLDDAPGGVKRFVVRVNDPLAAFGTSGSTAEQRRSPAA